MNRQWVFSLVVTLALGIVLGYALSRGPADEVGNDARSSTAGEQGGERKVLYWHDPMVPSQKFDKPGKSPFMDMQLVPVYADEAPTTADVTIDDRTAQNFGIRLAKVEKTTLPQQLHAVGSVAFDERLLDLVQARVSGYVTQLHVKAPFERVRSGQPLAEIVSSEWLAAQQEYLALLEGQSASVQPVREAARRRLSVLGVPESTIRAIETDRRTRPATTIFAPIDGVVTELAVRQGSSFSTGAPLFRINGLMSVWVNVQLPEAHLSIIGLGAKAIAHTTAWPGETFEGEVIALLPEVDPQTRTLTARMVIANRANKLIPGMYVTLDLKESGTGPQRVVPSEAVITTGERSVVIVAKEGGGFDVVSVTVGADVDGRSTILSGVSEGQSVVVSGQFLIDSEASLRSAVRRLESPAPQADEAKMAAPTATTQSIHHAQGTITVLTADQITIAHGPVATLNWPAMTMGFKRPSNDSSATLSVGDRVEFSFVAVPDGGGFQIERISVLAGQGMESPR